MLPVHAQVFAFVRAAEGARVLCVFNFSDQPVHYDLPSDCMVVQHLTDSGLTGANLSADRVDLAPWGGLFAQLT